MIKVCKFGGTSMADGMTMRRVKDIFESDPERRYIVVSAPGKRFSGDIKVTDLLYETHKEVEETGSCGEAFERICARFSGIVQELKIDLDIESILQETKKAIEEEKSADFAASRGEYLSGRIMAALLNIPFIDARDVIKFDASGKLESARSFELLARALSGKPKALVTGFYGEGADGKVKTFSRGGSDISGAIVARAAGAALYENWTDVSGFLACDPRIVENPVPIRSLSYKELRELSYMGANVLHSESIFPVRSAGIPIRICNTFRPEDEGTLIVSSARRSRSGGAVTGIAGKKDFTVIFLEKSMMNGEIGFAEKVLGILSRYGVSFEHLPTGIDTLSIVIDDKYLAGGVLEKIVSDIRAEVRPDSVRTHEGIALVATVGHGMANAVGTAARLFRSLSDAGINVIMIDQGSSELNIIVGVDNADCADCIRAVYREFFRA